MAEYFVHIGLPRTASTFWQTRVFPKIEGVHFYGPPYTTRNRTFQKLVYADDINYSKAQFKEEISKLKGDKIIISNEAFSGQSIYFNKINRSLVAHRIKEVLPDAKIFFFLRGQLDLLRSLYCTTLKASEYKSFDYFVWFPQKNYTLSQYQQKAPATIEYLHYPSKRSHEHIENHIFNDYIELYKGLFDDVSVMLYEDFLNDPKTIINGLENILDISIKPELRDLIQDKTQKVNKSVGERQVFLLRQINRLHPLSTKFLRPLIRGLKNFALNRLSGGGKLKPSAATTKKIRSFYSPYNKKLVENYPEIPLKKYKDAYFLD
jgi:hypothetical protein